MDSNSHVDVGKMSKLNSFSKLIDDEKEVVVLVLRRLLEEDEVVGPLERVPLTTLVMRGPPTAMLLPPPGSGRPAGSFSLKI